MLLIGKRHSQRESDGLYIRLERAVTENELPGGEEVLTQSRSDEKYVVIEIKDGLLF
jgi:hypothetical protein